MRRFGRLAVAEEGHYVGTLAVQGPDALDPRLTAEDFWRALRRSRRAVKTQLLSQRPIAGVGNIYADEALWRARINPVRRTVTRAQAAALLDGGAGGTGRQPALRRHDAHHLSQRRGPPGPQPTAARRLRPSRPAMPPLRHGTALPRARRPHDHVVPDLPARPRTRLPLPGPLGPPERHAPLTPRPFPKLGRVPRRGTGVSRVTIMAPRRSARWWWGCSASWRWLRPARGRDVRRGCGRSSPSIPRTT